MEKLGEGYPEHVAIIMDGNRRWAKSKGMPAGFGHKEGSENFKRITRYANKIGLKYLTVYAFSTENWKRSEEEIEGLMNIFQNYLDDFANRMDTENIRVKIYGDTSRFSERMQKSIQNVVEKTKSNTGLTVGVCLNYGGRLELTQAMKKIAKKVKSGEIDIEDINEEMISNNLYTAGIPDPDLLIRTSNELRTSNFLPWQITYSEFYFTHKNWPEFSEQDLDEALEEYKKRNRKFGGK
ncbi:MAG: isoprenyl transferase [Clostridia bacterium]|nr:isoprenyl transferase [Clostridia bacterium]